MSSFSFYDHRGNVMAAVQPGGLAAKYLYDGAGRLTMQFITDAGIGVLSTAWKQWSNAASVLNDIVLSQTENRYDANGNVILTIKKDPTAVSNGQTFSYHYKDGNSLLDNITTTLAGGGAGPTTTYVCQANTPWLQSITVKNPSGTTLYSITYVRDVEGRITKSSIGGLDASGASVSGVNNFTYDSTTGQLHTDDESLGGSTLASTTYSFDAVGNRTSAFGSVNALDQYGSFTYTSSRR